MRRFWAPVGIVAVLLLLCLVCLSAVAVRRHRDGASAVQVQVGSEAQVSPTPTRSVEVVLEKVEAGKFVRLTLLVRSSGPQALLFEPPILAGELPTSESLERARFELLDLATAGEARIVLEFPRPAQEPPWTLVFNPGYSPQDVVAPRVEILVEVR